MASFRKSKGNQSSWNGSPNPGTWGNKIPSGPASANTGKSIGNTPSGQASDRFADFLGRAQRNPFGGSFVTPPSGTQTSWDPYFAGSNTQNPLNFLFPDKEGNPRDIYDWLWSFEGDLSQSTQAYINFLTKQYSDEMARQYDDYQSQLAYNRQRFETDLAYDRTKFETLFNKYLAAGMSPSAAMQAAAGVSPATSGSSPSASTSPSSGGADASSTSMQEGISNIIGAAGQFSGNMMGLANMLQQRELSVANLVQTRDMFDISNVGNYQLQEGLDLLRPILGEWYNMYSSGNAPLDDSALLSPRHYLEWAQKQPSDSPHKKLASSPAFAAMMSNPAGYNAWNQFLQGNSNPYGWSGYLGRQADDRHKLDFGQQMLNKVNYDSLEKELQRLSIETEDFTKIHDIIRDETLVRLQYSQFQYQQYNTPEARQKWRESMLADLDMQKANAVLQVIKTDRINKGISKFDEEGLADVLNASAAMEYFGFDSWSRRAVSVAAVTEDFVNDASADASDVSSAFNQAVVDNSSAVLQWISDYNGPAGEFSKRFILFLLATHPVNQSSFDELP